MADNDDTDGDVPTTDLRELGADDTTENASFVERLRDRTESFRQARDKTRRKKRAKQRAGRLRKQRRRSALRQSADNVVQAVTGRSIDDIGEFGGTNIDEEEGGSTTTTSTRGDPSFLDVDGDGEEATVEFPSGGERDNGGGGILPEPGSENKDDSDEDGFPPLY